MLNCFLIREPEAVIASYAAVRSEATLEDIGFIQQAELFDQVREMSGETPVVIDSREFLLNPEPMLKLFCNRLEVDFDPAMLSWPKGVRESDGVWGQYWYDSVWQSTGFASYRERHYELSDKDRLIAEQARPYYDRLFQLRLKTPTN